MLGAVLTSLVVPVLVRAEKEDPDGGEAFIRRLMTLTFTLMGAVTVISILAAPFLVKVGLDDEGHVNIDIATSIAYLVLPQIVCFAMFAVFMAVLNTKGMFKPGAWAPVVNNVVTLGILVLYYLLPDETKLNPTESVTITNPHILLLGLGTTLGVVAQAAIMIPFLRKAGINMKPLWGVDKRLKAFGGMAIAIIVYVAISQAGWMLNNRIASQASDAAVTVYMQAWQLLQMPYGVIGVTLLTAIMPRLSRNAADGDDQAVVAISPVPRNSPCWPAASNRVLHWLRHTRCRRAIPVPELRSGDRQCPGLDDFFLCVHVDSVFPRDAALARVLRPRGSLDPDLHHRRHHHHQAGASVPRPAYFHRATPRCSSLGCSQRVRLPRRFHHWRSIAAPFFGEFARSRRRQDRPVDSRGFRNRCAHRVASRCSAVHIRL